MTKTTTAILVSLLICFPSYADELDKLVESKPYKEFSKRTDTSLSDLNKTWKVPDGTYGSLFRSRDSIQQIHNWLSTKSDLFTLRKKDNSEIGNTYFLQQYYSIDGHAPLRVEIYIPHPRHLEEARFGLLEAYRNLKPTAMNVDIQESVKVQGYDATQYEIKDGSCRLLINMPHEIRIYLVGRVDDLKILFKLGEELSLTRLEAKLDN